MKKMFFIFCMGFANMGYSSSTMLMPAHADLSFESVRKIFSLLGVEVATLQEANAYAQANFLRVDERRSQQPEQEIHKVMRNNAPQLMAQLKAIGMVDAIEPTQKKYAYALIMGSYCDTMQHRLAFLIQQLQNGLEVGTIVLLGGARPLADFEKRLLPQGLETETDMMVYLFKQNAALSDKNVITIDAPMIQKSDGTFTRPTTASTIIHFGKTAPQPGNCLVIASNPCIIRQTLVVQRLLDQQHFPTVGAGSEYLENGPFDIVMMMDEFARLLYENVKKLQS